LSASEQSLLALEYAEPPAETCREVSRSAAYRWPLASTWLWLGAAGAIIGMAIFLPFGWDAKNYLAALQQYSAYVNGHATFSLAYSPLFMIPVLSVAKLLPLGLVMALFGVAYLCGWLVQLRVGMQFATADERKILRYVAPVIAFFPGLLVSDVIVSGNLAYILYGLILTSAALGWKRQRWMWFYLAVLVAACVKVQLLTMLAIPLLCGKRQGVRATLTGVAGLGLYALQFRLWPEAFQAYLSSLKVMAQTSRDFGCGPAGNFARVLQRLGLPYETPCIVFYVAYAIVLFLILRALSRLYREHRVSFESWAPVMLLGVVLLDPRILTYDVAAVSLPMALVAWRCLRGDGQAPRTVLIVAFAMVLLVVNVFVELNEDWITVLPHAWKYFEMFLMVGIFAGGVRRLLQEAEVEWPAYLPETELVSPLPEAETASFD
jgi:hypothetical protein